MAYIAIPAERRRRGYFTRIQHTPAYASHEPMGKKENYFDKLCHVDDEKIYSVSNFVTKRILSERC